MTKNKKRNFWIISIFAAIFLSGLTIYCSLMLPIDKNNTLFIYIDSDDDIDSVCSKVDDVLPGGSDLLFNLMSKTSGYKHNVHTGRYAITPTTTTLELFLTMRGHRTVPVNLVIPVARTVDEMAEKISHQLMLDKQTLVAYFTDSVECRKLGFTPETMPAFFIPDTYEVYWDCSIKRLIDKLNDGYNQFWNSHRKAKAADMGMTPTEVSVLASIIDSETYVDKEKPTVAGLYINRLTRGMKLQSDPTVIFAIGDYSIHRVLKTQLMYDSPYNTYLHPGLPPGPIRIPSVAAIDAVLNYDHHNYIYMCAKEDLSGTHNFAATSTEHQQNARKYQKALNQRGIRE